MIYERGVAATHKYENGSDKSAAIANAAAPPSSSSLHGLRTITEAPSLTPSFQPLSLCPMASQFVCNCSPLLHFSSHPRGSPFFTLCMYVYICISYVISKLLLFEIYVCHSEFGGWVKCVHSWGFTGLPQRVLDSVSCHGYADIAILFFVIFIFFKLLCKQSLMFCQSNSYRRLFVGVFHC